MLCVCVVVILYLLQHISGQRKRELEVESELIPVLPNSVEVEIDQPIQELKPFTAFNSSTKEYELYQDSIGIVDLGNQSFDLEGETIYIKGPMTLKGPAKIKNAHIFIEDTENVDIEGIETENVYITLRNTSDVQIKNSVFQNIHEDTFGFMILREAVKDLKIQGNTFSNIRYKTSSSTYGCGIKFLAMKTEYSNIHISENIFREIYGPAAIWIGGHGTTLSNLLIEKNTIYDTASFGIEFYQYEGELNFQETRIKNNTLYNIGSVRELPDGAGCGGIYNNLHSGGIVVQGNQIKNILEVGIEGYFESIENNVIEDTGSDQANHPIKDSAGIYSSSPKIVGNTIINPGYYGGIHKYTSGILSGMDISGNTIKNSFEYWKRDQPYEKGDLVVAGEQWFICLQAGHSGEESLSGTSTRITDGTCIWSYKKPLSSVGINLNAEGGLQNIEISNNTVMDMQYFNSLSGLINHINIVDNTYQAVSFPLEKMQFLTGYGNRTIESGTVEIEPIKNK